MDFTAGWAEDRRLVLMLGPPAPASFPKVAVFFVLLERGNSDYSEIRDNSDREEISRSFGEQSQRLFSLKFLLLTERPSRNAIDFVLLGLDSGF